MTPELEHNARFRYASLLLFMLMLYAFTLFHIVTRMTRVDEALERIEVRLGTKEGSADAKN